MAKKLTKGAAVAADLTGLLKARNCVVWIVSREEARVERLICDAAVAARLTPHTWDVARGACNMDGTPSDLIPPPPADPYGPPPGPVVDPVSNINAIIARSVANKPNADCWIFRDLPVWLGGAQNGAPVLRTLRNAVRLLPPVALSNGQAIVVLSPDSNVPPELSGIPVIEFPLPDRDEIDQILEEVIEDLPNIDPAQLPEEERSKVKVPFFRDKVRERLQNGVRSAAIDAAIGLNGDEVTSTFARSLVLTGTVDPVAVATEKKRVIGKEKLIEWFDPDPRGLSAVGGLNALKAWLQSRKNAWSKEARAYGLPLPKGILLLGVPGCGKSLVAKTIGTAYACPLIRFDLNAMKGKFVGESEGNLRRVLQLFTAIGRCVIWIDELEKALAGATQGAADGGVSSDALGTLLSWMQDRESEAFVVATCNDVNKLPPELLRKGRFDEIFAVDLPDRNERVEILQATLRQHKRDKVAIDVAAVTDGCEEFTGSEVASLVSDSLFRAFSDGAREITTADLIEARSNIVPLAKTMGDQIKKLRAFATSGQARRATTPLAPVPTAAVTSKSGRSLDL